MEAIKQRARHIAQTHNPEGLVPFPFAALASRLGDVEILYLETDTEISGAIYFQDGRFTILVNIQKPEERQYFTIAHEFGHYFLHADWLRQNGDNGFVDFSEVVDGQTMLLRADSPSDDPQKELEANNFAAELIMPEDKVREFWGLTHDISACANAFLVSKSAMAVRLEKLGLV
jgi:Zn-dependent peptidase ImmA (M78 family)